MKNKVVEIALAVLVTVNAALGVSNPMNWWVAVGGLTILIFAILTREPETKLKRASAEALYVIDAYVKGPGGDPASDADALIYVAAWLDRIDKQVNKTLIAHNQPLMSRSVQNRLRDIARRLGDVQTG